MQITSSLWRYHAIQQMRGWTYALDNDKEEKAIRYYTLIMKTNVEATFTWKVLLCFLKNLCVFYSQIKLYEIKAIYTVNQGDFTLFWTSLCLPSTCLPKYVKSK